MEEVTTQAPKARKSEAFVRLANKRVANAVQAIRLVGNLSNRTNYDYDTKQVAKIVKAIQSELDIVKDKFATGSGQEGRFSL